MSHWNHRVFRQPDKLSGYWYTIREVYYEDNGKIKNYSAEARGVGGENIKDIKETLEWMGNCLDKPIIELDEKGEIKK